MKPKIPEGYIPVSEVIDRMVDARAPGLRERVAKDRLWMVETLLDWSRRNGHSEEYIAALREWCETAPHKSLSHALRVELGATEVEAHQARSLT